VLEFLLGPYALTLLFLVLVNVTLASSLNLITGYAGQVSIGHVAFYAIGAYTAALASAGWGWGVWLTLPLAAGVSFGAGLVIGAPSLRVEHDFLAIVTLGLGLVVQGLALNLDFTGGPYGISGVRRVELFGTPAGPGAHAALAAGLAVVTVAAVWRIRRSRVGTALLALRDDALAAEVTGIDTARYKVLAFALGGLFAGAAGGLFAHYAAFVSPESFDLAASVSVLAMVVVGGLGTLGGPVLGAAVLTLLPELMRFTAEYRMLLYGLMLVAVMRYLPRGILGSRVGGRAR
jgi:branched-chain amino acid transport system permease protein